MGRAFLPTLRGLRPTDSGLLVPEESESKSLTINGYSSMTNLAAVTTYGTGIHRADAWDMEAVISEGYERVVWVFRCVELIAGHASRLPFRIGRGDDDEREVMEIHPLYRVMNKRANPLETGRHFRKRLSAQLLLSKKGVFVEVTKSRAGTISRLDLLDPSRVRIVEDPHGDYISHFEFTRRDGQMREIDPERIRWIREPHPTDPFSGVTPLEAAGMSVQLDFLSRLYNVSFIQNDSRPGGVLGVDADTLTDQEMDRLERKFKPGAQHAGEMTVIGTGPGGINYVDTTTKPRDMAYGEAASNAKNEVLSAFGIGESLLGNASGRSFDNAEQELYNFWTQPMPPHLELIAAAFDQDVDEEWDPFIDTSSVEVLELPRRRDREEALKEYNAGLRSIDEYRPMAGLEPVGIAQTRALWISPAKAPVPTRPEDAAALGMEDPNGGGSPDGGGMPPEGGPEGAPGDAAAAVEEARQDGAAPPPGSAAEAVDEARQETSGEQVDGDAAAALAEARADGQGGLVEGDAAAAVEEARMEGKALDPTNGSGTFEYAPGEQEGAAAELGITAALTALLARQQGVIEARIESPKTRKGTKFWTADSPTDTRGGEAPLDAGRVADPEKWEQEAAKVLEGVAAPAGTAAAEGLLAALVGAGVIVTAVDAAGLTVAAGRAATAPVLAAITEGAAEVGKFAREVSQLIATESLVATTSQQLVGKVREFYASRAESFARSLATSLAHGVVNGARHSAVASLVGMVAADGRPDGFVTTWHSRKDARVRPSHRDADGQTVPFGEPFVVGGVPLWYPADPAGPPALTYGCRCWLSYRVLYGSRFLMMPITEVA